MKSLSLMSCALLALSVSAAPYTVTSYVVLSVYTQSGFTRVAATYSDATYAGTTQAESLITYTEPANRPTTAYSALSTLTTAAEYGEVTLVEIVLESAPEDSPSSESDDSAALETQYVVPITYGPDASCAQNWTLTSMVPVYVPAIVTPTIASLSTSVSTYSYDHIRPTVYTEVLAILSPSDVPASDVASASVSYAPNSYYLTRCYTPTTTCLTSPTAECSPDWSYDYGSSSGRGASYYGSDHDDNSYLTPLILICVLVPVGWFLIWFLIGLLESWLSFKGLMLGKHRKRGLPYAWCCIMWLFLCWVGPTYKAKSAEEQALMASRWKELKKREKLSLWFKWGLRWKYPTVLGEEPELAKRAFRQGCL